MKNTTSPLNNVLQHQVFMHNLNRIYFAKRYINGEMERLIEMASFHNLQLGMQEYLDDVKKQIKRMDVIFDKLKETPTDKDCNPLRAIVKDQYCLSDNYEIAMLKDMDIICFMQMLEHINMALYRLLKTIAKALKYTEVAQLLRECFDECYDNDQLFVMIGEEYVKL